MVDQYIKYKTSKPSEEDEDIITYEEVEVIKTLTAMGPDKGKKYYRVDYHTLSRTLVFRLKNGGCIMVECKLDDSPATYIGERSHGLSGYLKKPPKC